MHPETHPTVTLAPKHVQKAICTRCPPCHPPLPLEQLDLRAVAATEGHWAVGGLRAPAWQTHPPSSLLLEGQSPQPGGRLAGVRGGAPGQGNEPIGS